MGCVQTKISIGKWNQTSRKFNPEIQIIVMVTFSVKVNHVFTSSDLKHLQGANELYQSQHPTLSKLRDMAATPKSTFIAAANKDLEIRHNTVLGNGRISFSTTNVL